MKPTISVAFVSRTTLRQAFTRSSDRSIGFSQKIALPARAKRSIRSAWVSVGVQITTASMSAAASIASMLRIVAAVLAGDGLRRVGEGVGDGDEPGIGIAGDGLGVHLADAACAQKSEPDSHGILVNGPDRPCG